MSADERSLRAAAEGMCRELSIQECDRLNKVVRPTGYYAHGASFQFFLYLNGKSVDEDGNVIDRFKTSREPARFFGPDGLVNLWAVVKVIESRAATLGVEVKCSVKFTSSVDLRQSEKPFTTPSSAVPDRSEP